MKNKLLAILISLTMLIVMAAPAFAAAEDAGFTDVATDAWYAEAVAYCREHGLMYGTSNTMFQPESALTRAILVTVLYRSAGSPAVTGADNFTDTVEGAYYADAVVWASQQGIIDDYGNGLFGTNDSISQNQMRLIFQKYTDTAVTQGIPGFDGSSRNATRAQAASALMNLEFSKQTVPDPAEGNSILIAYFSFEGHTEQIAEEIHAQIGGDLFEITPEKPYTGTRYDLSGIASAELHKNARPALSTHVNDMDQYDVVFIGYPCWWSNAPMAVFTFLEEYDFSGKTVVPFTSYGESVWGSSLASIQRSVGNHAAIVEGLAVQEETMQDLPARVTAWLQGLGLIKK